MKPQLVKKLPAPAVNRTAERDLVVDEYAPLAIQVQTLRARLRVLEDEEGRFIVLKRQIRAWFDKSPAEQRALYETERYTVEIGAKENEASPDNQAMVDLFGLKRFLALCTITRKAAEAELAKLRKVDLIEKLFPKERTGERTVKVIAKAGQEAA